MTFSTFNVFELELFRGRVLIVDGELDDLAGGNAQFLGIELVILDDDGHRDRRVGKRRRGGRCGEENGDGENGKTHYSGNLDRFAHSTTRTTRLPQRPSWRKSRGLKSL